MNPVLAFFLRNVLNGGLVVSVLALIATIWIRGLTS